MRIFIGILIGIGIGFFIWFPYGISYAVQANSHSAIVKIIALLKGVVGL